MKKDEEYKKIMLGLFCILIDIYDIDKAIILLYEINNLRGKKI